MYSETLKPGALLGPYPERPNTRHNPVDAAIHGAARRLHNPAWLGRRRAQQFAAHVENLGEPLTDMAADQLLRKVRAVRGVLLQTGLQDDDAVAEAFALVREMASRTLDQRHYPNQVAGGWIILNGMLAEMETGEGKTLTATLPASVAAFAGIPVHVITTSDYLAKRDAETMSPLYATLGLTVGTVTADLEDPAARRAAYACDICYVTNKQVAFDYLRDRVATDGPRSRLSRLLDRVSGAGSFAQPSVLRGLCFGIVDEADSVLIDEARTPLILSRPLTDIPDPIVYQQALFLATQLASETDYVIEADTRRVELTENGCSRLAGIGHLYSGMWARRRQREALVTEALRATHLFLRDEHYLVRDGKVQIIDENTGRTMEDRSWERGLHQIIETKENVEITPPTEAIARISYQQYFRRYLRLGAMTGTATEVATELLSTYGLQVVRIDTHRPLQRTNCGSHLYPTVDAKWQATIARIQALHAEGRPVLIGTRTVADSEDLSHLLAAAGVKHTVLNARQDEDEAAIVAQAGEQGRITIATNMAGRGTDIVLGEGVAELGGLHVIMTENNDARRIDRQLYGRCGRQGNPGSYEAFLSLQDRIVKSVTLPRQYLMLNQGVANERSACALLGKGVMRFAQRGLERQHRGVRRGLAQLDESTADALSFAGVS
jgi:preprotein translocase subunit SecA